MPFLGSEEEVTLEAVESRFLDHFGLSLEEADSAWRTTSFEEYTWGDLCDPARALTWNGSSLELKGGVDCTQPDTIGPSYDGGITTRSHCFTLEEPGLVRVELSATAPRATATFRQFGCARDEQLDFEYYDLRIVKEGEPRDLPMGACTWEISVTRRGLILESRTPVEPMEFTLRLSKL